MPLHREKISPGAAPAYRISAETPPTNTATGSSGIGNTVVVNSPSVPGGLVCNLDFVESLFGNAGDPFLAANDAGLDVEHWTGHTGCVILAPHIVGLNKKALGLPHVSEATERQKRDGMCWSKPDEKYNDGKSKLKQPSGTLSTAEAISVMNNGLALASHFGDGSIKAADLASGLVGAVVKDPVQDRVVWQEYLETVVKERDGWKDLYRACRAEL